MYYPYLRGKQFDLLALSTLVKEQRWSRKIMPIIEPVRDSATLKKTFELFQKEKLVLYVIENPQVGRFKFFETKQHHWQLKADTSIFSAGIVTNQAFAQTNLIIFNEKSTRDQNLLDFNQLALLPNQGRFRVLPFQQKIILDDAFIARKKVEDYRDHDDDFFSDQHLYYQTDGFVGFSDYTIESSKYFDKGGPSRAIAIHITYFDAYLNLRIKHFVSDTNDSAKDQALKFFEAAEKMRDWYQRNQDQLLLTLGMTELMNYLKIKKFPGLGTIKKWALAHHLELLGAYLEQGNHYLKGWATMGYKDEDFILRQAKQMGEALGNIIGQEAADEIMLVEAQQGQKKDDELLFRKTTLADIPTIMLLIQDATAYLKEQGSPQWQNNQAPSEETIQNDIKNDVSYVLTLNQEVVGLCALIAEKDPAYEAIDGSWKDLGTDNYVAIHRVAASSQHRGMGLGQKLLEEAIKKAQSLGYKDIRIDTYPTNGPMLHLIDKVGFTYRGMIEFDFINGERKAFQLI